MKTWIVVSEQPHTEYCEYCDNCGGHDAEVDEAPKVLQVDVAHDCVFSAYKEASISGEPLADDDHLYLVLDGFFGAFEDAKDRAEELKRLPRSDWP